MIQVDMVGSRLLSRLSSDMLYKNSFYLVANRALVVLTGFVFWMVATRVYTVDDVGLAVAFISSSQLICSLAILGFDTSIIRFFNNYDRSRIFNTSLLVVTATSLALSFIYILGVRYLTPDLAALQDPVYGAVFLLFTTVLSVATITAQSFVAMRDAKYSFIQNLLLTLRIPLLIPLLFLGSFGILSATFLAYAGAYVVVFYFLGKFIELRPRIDFEFIKMSYKFSFGNYLSSMIFNATSLLLPLIILAMSGSADAGLFYIGFTVGNFALQIPLALSLSYFVEGVYGQSLKKNVKKIGLAIFVLLAAIVGLFFALGDWLLGLYGGNYVAASGLLRLIALSSFPYAGYVLFTIVLNMKMRVNYILLLNAMLFVLVIGLSLFLIPRFGITGVGYAFIAGYVAVDLYILYLIKKWGWA